MTPPVPSTRPLYRPALTDTVRSHRRGVAHPGVRGDGGAAAGRGRLPAALSRSHADQGQGRHAHLLAARQGGLRQAAADSAATRVRFHTLHSIAIDSAFSFIYYLSSFCTGPKGYSSRRKARTRRSHHLLTLPRPCYPLPPMRPTSELSPRLIPIGPIDTVSDEAHAAAVSQHVSYMTSVCACSVAAVGLRVSGQLASARPRATLLALQTPGWWRRRRGAAATVVAGARRLSGGGGGRRGGALPHAAGTARPLLAVRSSARCILVVPSVIRRHC